MGQSLTREELIERIRTAAQELGVSRLKFAEFQKITGITKRRILGSFDCWSDACAAAGVDSGPTGRENLVPNRAISKEVLIAELKRVASLVGREFISQTDFREHSTLNPITPSRTFGGWAKALAAAGLKAHPFFHKEKPFEEMATKFLDILTELRAIPTLNQVARRTGHSQHLFSRKYGGYLAFKRRAVEFLTGKPTSIPGELLAILQAEKERLGQDGSEGNGPIREHQHGAVLGFRAFAYKPTYEMEVVSMFSVVAEELGFEIVCQRGEFPDCEAQRRIPGRRKRYKKCLIEFELDSSDFRPHGHSPKGCDLIVCWKHDWEQCPVEVLELRETIKSLPGWKK
ncbi:MAG: hypothetical protein NTV86_06345 [Planctomycetota bacterium]|nr:hypothetical protein [Planctomycetota bacterium]